MAICENLPSAEEQLGNRSECFPGGSCSKASVYNVGDLGSIPGSGRSPRVGHSTPLQYSCLENPHGQRSLWTTVHGVTKSWTRLSD